MPFSKVQVSPLLAIISWQTQQTDYLRSDALTLKTDPVACPWSGSLMEVELFLEGSFHKIHEATRIIGWNKILQLHRLEKDLARVKTELGF